MLAAFSAFRDLRSGADAAPLTHTSEQVSFVVRSIPIKQTVLLIILVEALWVRWWTAVTNEHVCTRPVVQPINPQATRPPHAKRVGPWSGTARAASPRNVPAGVGGGGATHGIGGGAKGVSQPWGRWSRLVGSLEPPHGAGGAAPVRSAEPTVGSAEPATTSSEPRKRGG